MLNKLALYLQPLASADLEDIYDYTITEWSEKQAIIYQDALFEYFELICKNPTIGSQYPFGQKDYRRLTALKHIIFYRVENSQIIVIRILHSRMDYNEHL